MAQSKNLRKIFGEVDITGNQHLGNSGDGFNVGFDGTNTLNIDPVNANDTVRIGETTQADLQVDGATDLLWDASAGSLTNNSFLGLFVPNAASQSVTGAGAANVTSPITYVTTNGVAQVLTLADGTAIGQIKCIVLIVDGGDCVLTPATFADGTTLTFADANDFVVLVWGATGWRVIVNVGGTVA